MQIIVYLQEDQIKVRTMGPAKRWLDSEKFNDQHVNTQDILVEVIYVGLQPKSGIFLIIDKPTQGHIQRECYNIVVQFV